MIIDRTACFFVIDRDAALVEAFGVVGTGCAGDSATRRVGERVRVPSFVADALQAIVFFGEDVLAEFEVAVFVGARGQRLQLGVGRTEALGRAARVQVVGVVAVLVLLVVLFESVGGIGRHAERLGTFDVRARDRRRQTFRGVPVPRLIRVVELVVRPALADLARILSLDVVADLVLNPKMLANCAGSR